MAKLWRFNLDKLAARYLVVGLIFLQINVVHASTKELAQVHVAVASNFLGTAQQLKSAFEKDHDINLLLSAASTGKLFAQVVHGAPYEVFMSADQARPKQLEQQGVIQNSQRIDYAIGELVVWHPNYSTGDFEFQTMLKPEVARVAMANPRTAPYGLAAQQFLSTAKLLDDLKPKLVRGENVGQAIQFVRSGNAQVGIVARSMLIALNENNSHYTAIEQRFYQPIIQQLVVLSERSEVSQFVDFLTSERARLIIKQNGYRLP